MITNSQSCGPLGQCHVPWHITSIHFSWTIFPQTHKHEPARRLHHVSDLGSLILIRIILMEYRLPIRSLHPIMLFPGRFALNGYLNKGLGI